MNGVLDIHVYMYCPCVFEEWNFSLNVLDSIILLLKQKLVLQNQLTASNARIKVILEAKLVIFGSFLSKATLKIFSQEKCNFWSYIFI